MCAVHTLFTFTMRSAWDDGVSLATSRLRTAQQFSIGLRSGEEPGQGLRSEMCSAWSQSATFFEVWQGAPSCWIRNRHVKCTVNGYSKNRLLVFPKFILYSDITVVLQFHGKFVISQLVSNPVAAAVYVYFYRKYWPIAINFRTTNQMLSLTPGSS